MKREPLATRLWKVGALGRMARSGAGLLAFGLLLGAPFLQADTVTATVTSSSDDADTAKTADAPSPSPPANEVDSTQKADETPHFWQRDARGGFENEGRDYCCPVAVSNSLVYLAHHGFPALLSRGDGVQPQIDLINLLASSDYFGTDPKNGTSPGEVLGGVQKYIEDKGYSCERLEYEGWRKVGRKEEDAVQAQKVSLDWLEKGIVDPHGAVWLNIGWYNRVGDGEWKRNGGHWVTLVGMSNASTSHPRLLVHNPATRGNNDGSDDPAQDVIYLHSVDQGTLDTGKDSTQDAAGMYRISGPGVPLASGVDAAFIDAAIVLVVGS